MGSVEGKTVVATGAARGPGATFAAAVSRQGADGGIRGAPAVDGAVGAMPSSSGDFMTGQTTVVGGSAVMP